MPQAMASPPQHSLLRRGLATLLAGTAGFLSRAAARIVRHESDENGDLRVKECTSLDDCLSQGFSTPAMVLHRTWTLEIDQELQKRHARIKGLNKTGAFIRQREVRRVLRKRLLHAELPSDAPLIRMVRQFTDEERGVKVILFLFETWPGHSVPAVLFTPIGAQPGDKLAGILHLTGHLAQGFRDPAEQRLSLGLAQQGYAVMSFDPLSQGQRHQYEKGYECGASCDDGECKSSGGPCSAAHDHFGRQLWLLGRSAAELFMQDSVRALDVLASLPWVDNKRLGAVGCSGGGMLTAYLGAVDPRLKAVAIACYFSTLEEELLTGTCNYDAEQILWRQAKLHIDKPDLLVARAPRPTLVVMTSHDCFPLAGGRAGFAQASKAFAAHFEKPTGEMGLYGSEAMGYHEVTSTAIEGIHTLFRENLMEGTWSALPLVTRTVSQFSPVPLKELLLKDEQLQISARGGRPSHIGDLIRGFAQPALQRLRTRRLRARKAQRSSWLRSLPQISARTAGLDIASSAKAFAAILSSPPPLKLLRARFYPSGVEEWYTLPSQGACQATLRVFHRVDDNESFERVQAARINDSLGIGGGSVTHRTQSVPMALLVGGGVVLNRGLEAREEALVMELHAFGIDTVIAGLCGLGDSLWKGGLWDFAPLLLGKTHVALHTDEMLRIIAWMISVLKASSVILIGVEDASAAVLHAALQVPIMLHRSNSSSHGVVGVALVRSICCYAGVVSTSRHKMPWQMQMYDVLNKYDLPDLLASVAESAGVAGLVTEPQDALKLPLSWRSATNVYKLAQRRFRASGSLFRVLAGKLSPSAEGKALANFVAAAARQ